MNRSAWGLVCLAILLICAGGLVTAYRAGMAIPDWPTTFGHWIYLPHRWLGQFDGVFLNQLHRTLALLTLAWAVVVATVVWRSGSGRQVRMLSLAIVFGLLVQGAAGGWRVLSDSVPVARVHGAMAPLVLGLCMALAVVTSQRWRAAQPARRHPYEKALRRWCLATLVLAYLLIVANVQMRHVPPTAGLTWLPFWAWSKLLLAAVAAVVAGRLLVLARRRFGDCPVIPRRTGWLVGLLAVQLLLGGGVWIANYGWPPWFADYVLPIRYTVTADGVLRTATTTAHIVVGAVVTAVGANAALWTYREIQEPRKPKG